MAKIWSSTSNHWLIDDEYTNDEINLILLTLKKPVELKKIMDSIPKPAKAVPKNGLPRWYKIGLECKLPVPEIPQGKIIYSRGKIGQDLGNDMDRALNVLETQVRRFSLRDGHVPEFDLSDPHCHNISYAYDLMHDPNLARYFAQKPCRNRMQRIGLVTRDGRAVCTLKEFNEYRKILYKQFMDRMHAKLKKIDELALDDLTLRRVDDDIAHRKKIFTKTEAERIHLNKMRKLNAEQWEEKKRLAKEREQAVKQRILRLIEFKQKQRQEHAARSKARSDKIQQRILAAAEIELKRKITMKKNWRRNENKRTKKHEEQIEETAKKKKEEAEAKWLARVQEQTKKIHEESLLLKIYTEDMTAAAERRHKKSLEKSYRRDLALQRIKLANLKIMRGEHRKSMCLAKKMGAEFERIMAFQSILGSKGMTRTQARSIAAEAMRNATSVRADRLVALGQARELMDKQVVLPSPPLKLLEEAIETAIKEFARCRINALLRAVERKVRFVSAQALFAKKSDKTRNNKEGRWIKRLSIAMAQAQQSEPSAESRESTLITTVVFGDITHYPSEIETDHVMKSVKDRPPTPVPSKTTLAEVIFLDRIADLPDPVAIGGYLPERKKLLEMVNTTEKLLTRAVTQHVEKGIDKNLYQITLPNIRHRIEWGEAVEGISAAVIDNRISSDCGDVRRVAVYLAYRILRSILDKMRSQRRSSTNTASSSNQPFYEPDKVRETPNGAN